jgi:hypothetical protein
LAGKEGAERNLRSLPREVPCDEDGGLQKAEGQMRQREPMDNRWNQYSQIEAEVPVKDDAKREAETEQGQKENSAKGQKKQKSTDAGLAARDFADNVVPKLAIAIEEGKPGDRPARDPAVNGVRKSRFRHPRDQFGRPCMGSKTGSTKISDSLILSGLSCSYC